METCKAHNFLQPIEASNYYLFVISSANNRKNASFTVKSLSAVLYSTPKDRSPSTTAEDGSANDDRKRSLMHVTLKTGVKIQIYLFGLCSSIKLKRNVRTSYFQLYSFTTNEKHYVVLIRE